MQKDLCCSIVVPVHNREHLLPRCIESLLSLKMPSYEVILVDDGSADDAGAICDTYAKKDGCVRVIHQKNQGVVSARAAGLRLSKGEYVLFVDSDDWLEADCYTWMIEQMEQHEEIDIGVPRLIYSYENGAPPKDMYPVHQTCVLSRDACMQEIFVNRKNFGWEVGKLYRRSILENWVPDKEAYPAEDLDMFWQMLNHARKVLYDGSAIYHYWIHTQNAVNGAILKNNVVRVFEKILKDAVCVRDDELKENVALRAISALFTRIYRKYFHCGNLADETIVEDIMKLKRLYQNLPDKSRAPFIVKVAVNQGQYGIETYFRKFFDDMQNAVRSAQRFSTIYIYGAGRVSEWLTKVMNEMEQPFSAYVVSDGEKKANTLHHGKEIRPVSEIGVDNQKNVFILAVSEQYRGQIVSMLRNRGHENMISFPTFPIFEKIIL